MESIHYDGNSKDGAGDTFGSRASTTAQAAKNFLTPQDGVNPGERSEGTITKKIESVTSKVPSGAFLSFAFGAMGVSALLHATGRKEDAAFIGQWVPAILIMGLYNKLVKLEGSA